MLKELGKEKTTKLLSTFKCPLNLDVENFLHHIAIRFEESAKARTYLILDDSTGFIAAYFSLSFKELSLENLQASKSEIKKLDGIDKHAENIKVYLIGQIAKNLNAPNNPIKLQDILDAAFAVIHGAQALIGGRAIIIECENKEKLISLYESHQFKQFTITDDSDSLITLYTYIK